jgi:MinD superfamily P-loop ATPase
MTRAPALLKIAIASGKGGTGKTTVASNLALTLARSGEATTYIDCDVEEPNGHIFLKPEIGSCLPICVMIPSVDIQKCTACGRCQGICQYSAIVVIKGRVLTFSDLCHSCGGCALVCPEEAIAEAKKQIGVVESGRAGPLRFVQGALRVGHASATPVVRATKSEAPEDGILIFDVAPGIACPAVEAQRGADFVVLVTEPTPFGLNDLRLAVETARLLDLHVAVVINRCDIGDSSVVEYCEGEGIEVLAQIPDDRRIAESYSRGELIVDALPEYAACFYDLAARVIDRAAPERAGRSPSCR